MVMNQNVQPRSKKIKKNCTPRWYEYDALTHDTARLECFSPPHTGWLQRRKDATAIQNLYGRTARYSRLANRMGTCCTLLGLRETVPDEWGEIKHKLADKKACHCRHCPICMQARAWTHTSRASAALPAIVEAHPNHRWLFLTLTVKNPKMENLRDKLRDMNKAWGRFKELQDFPASGWLRATEVTKGQDGNPHPHFHILMCVPPDYFTGGGYVNKDRCLAMWRASMRDESIMKVDIRVVKPRAGTPVADTLKYVFKYSTKVDEILEDPDFLYGLTDQLHKSRFIASGGIMKGIMKKPEKGLSQEEVEQQIDREVEVDRKINFMKSGGVGVRDYAGEYEEEGGEAEEAEVAPTPMSDEDFESADYLAGCVQRYEEHIEVVRASETLWAGNIPVLEQGLASARKELAGFLASVVAKSAREVRIAERRKWIADRREARRIRAGAIIDAYLQAESEKEAANKARPMHFFSWQRRSSSYTRSVPYAIQCVNVVRIDNRRVYVPVAPDSEIWDGNFLDTKSSGAPGKGKTVYCPCGCGESRLEADFFHRPK